MRITIRSRILLIFIGVFCIQALIIGVFLVIQHNKEAHNHIQQQLLSNAENIGTQIATFFYGIQRDLETASHQIERIAQKDYQRHYLLNTLKDNNPALSGLAFFDLNGTVRSFVSNHNSNCTQHCFTKHKELFTKTYNSGKPYIFQLKTSNGTPCLSISQPVFFLNKTYVFGVISALIPMVNVQTILDLAVFPEHHSIFILDDKETLLAKSYNSPSNFAYVNSSGKVKFNKNSAITSRVPVEFLGQKLYVVSIVDKQKTINFFTKSFNQLTLLFLLFVFLSFFVGWTTFIKIIAPLQTLATSSSLLANGKNIESLSIPNDIEFQGISSALKNINEQLLKSNESLEIEIKKRTLQEQSAVLAKIDAEKANQAKSIFLANMSHEIRTPLHSINGMLKMLEHEPLSTNQQHHLTMALVACNRLQTILNSILDLSQIESGKFKLHQTLFSLSNLLEEVATLMDYQGQVKGISVQSVLDQNLPQYLIGDAGRIRQTLINLVNNALKFTDSGTITIQVQPQKSLEQNKIQLLFKVTDSGDGISLTDQEKIFAAFERGKMESEVVIEGSGLGLAISSEFVEHMGGKLWLDKTGNEGSIFAFNIVCEIDNTTPKTPSNKQPPLVETQEGSLRDMSIMLAEDEFINQRIITAYLEELGATVVVCQHGEELLAKLDHKATDIILMDIRMPVMNGLEATEKIRALEAEHSLSPIPIVALTAQASTDFEEKCKNVGMNGYLTKPFAFDKLLSLILDLVSQGKNRTKKAKNQ